MIEILILIALLCVLLLVCHMLSKYNILTPQFGFVACFIPQLVYALFYVKRWDLQLSTATFSILLLGAIEFVLVSLGVHAFNQQRRAKAIYSTDNTEIKQTENTFQKIVINKIFLLLFILFQAMVFLFIIRFLKSNFSGSSLSSAIYSYRHANLFSDDKVYLPGWLSLLRVFSCASGYFWIYPLLHSLVYRYKSNKILIILNIALSAANSVILGGRGGLIQLAVAVAVQFYFIKGQKESWSKKIKMKTVAKVLGISILAIAVFQVSASFLGRDVSKYSFSDYISVYLSAEVKNLDTFVREGNFGADMSNTQTLVYVANFLDGKFAFANGWSHELDLPFHSAGGMNLGNVNTIYYAFLYDGGYLAVVIYIALMAFISQCLFASAVRKKKNQSLIDTTVIIYSYVYFTIIFSFFSPKFYEMIFNPNFVKMLVCWFALSLIVKYSNKIKIKV